ncbi:MULTISPECIES: tetratricopeptide repeat protein [unclassified Pseudodesulfovibrio]|uniref:tetratricopeptide repeat protein n=1 Tax=unclassified Pseudodesulfovibrio TaxID=2661612 RepID=UPI000FEB5FBA|nr:MULTISPECIES: tetratricopeptide repeat protein [unclassified Pseudodesulfovibrio]MCJ2162985.1 hypothetical protein [Pseudodesulfovibrio sp. S3-i]RWU06982.1 hypothetical protein DWB63_00295 [Pseudodesulfovibrio sp. S3]
MKQTNSASTLIFLAVLLVLSGCVTGTSVGVGMGGGNTRVGVGMGTGGTSVGMGVGGFGLSLNSHGDFLNNGPNEAYTNNKVGINQLLEGKYDDARKTFEDTLQKYPNQPDATYYLGLTFIYQGDREAGFALLKGYREQYYYRGTSAVQRMAAHLEKKPELSAEEIHKAMNRERVDGYKQDIRERQELRRETW